MAERLFENLIDKEGDEVTIEDYLNSISINVITPLKYLYCELLELTAFENHWEQECYANEAEGLMSVFKNIMIVFDRINCEADDNDLKEKGLI